MVTRQSKDSIINRIRHNIKQPHLSKRIETVEDIENVLNSFAAHTKKLETSIFEKGSELGILETQLEIAEKMIRNGMNIQDIRKITGMSFAKIGQLRKKHKVR